MQNHSYKKNILICIFSFETRFEKEASYIIVIK